MPRTLYLLWCMIVCFQLRDNVRGEFTIPPLTDENGKVLIEESSNSLVDPDVNIFIEAVTALSSENAELREELLQHKAQTAQLIKQLQKENLELREQLNNNAALTTDRMTDISERIVATSQETSQVVQEQLSNLINLVDANGVNTTLRLDQLDVRLTSAENMLQLQTAGCGCQSELADVEQRVTDLETLAKGSTGSVHTTPRTYTSETASPTRFETMYTRPITGTNPPQEIFVPMSTTQSGRTGNVQLVFAIAPSVLHPHGDSLVTGILITKDGKLLTTDRVQLEMRMASLKTPEVAEATLSVVGIPWAMMEMKDGRIALTLERSAQIVIIAITDNALKISETIKTEVNYGGIVQGPGDTFIVSKWQEDSTARLDIITMDGRVQRTLFQNPEIMIDPFCVKRVGDDLLVSDWTSSRLFGVDVNTGEVTTLLDSHQLSQPRKFEITKDGTIYLATGGRVCNENYNGYFCIIRMTSSGDWTRMDDYTSQDIGKFPYGVGLNSDQIIFSWALYDGGWKTELTAYTLPAPLPKESTPQTTVMAPTRTTEGTGNEQKLVFTVTSSTLNPHGDSLVTGILITIDEKLLTTDREQSEMRMASLKRPEVAEATLSVGGIPWAMMEMKDGRIALTLERSAQIVIIAITDNVLQISETINTEVNYGGIVQGPGDTFIVSKWQGDSTARLDIITMDGRIQRTLFQNPEIMIDPFCVKRVGDDLFVSDWTSSRLFRVDVNTGEAYTLLDSHQLYQPRKFDIAEDGTMYLATGGRVCNEDHDGYYCIIQVTSSGDWTRMERYTSQKDGGYPYGVGLAQGQIVISWGLWDYGWESVLTSYTLTSPLPSKSITQKTEAVDTWTTEGSGSDSGSEHLQGVEFAVPSSAIEKYGSSLITSVIVTDQGKLVMTDYAQQEVKLATLDPFDGIEDKVYLGLTPWSLVQLSDGAVAVTMEDEPKITFLNISDADLVVESSVRTERRYRGVAEFDNDTIVVSTRQNDDKWSDLKASIDVIGRDGKVISTLLSGNDNQDLIDPFFLTRHGGDLYISDWTSHQILVLNLETNNVSTRFGNTDLSDIVMYTPRVVAIDKHGNMYVATGGRVCDDQFCVIQINPEGHWRKLENYSSKHGGKFPYGIDVTSTQIIISWGIYSDRRWRTELTVYALPDATRDTRSAA